MTITILAAYSQDGLDRNGAVVEEECDTIKKAKQRARYFLTDEYRRASESSSMLHYSQVRKNGIVVADYST